MSTNQTLLKILQTVPYVETLSDVANHLYLAQPYISKTLKEAETLNNVTLVDRVKPIKLTRAGRAMVNGLQSLIDDEQQLFENLRAISKHEDQPIQVGVTNSFLSDQVSELLSKYYVTQSDRKFEVRLLQSASGNIEKIETSDIVIGKQFISDKFEQLAVPKRQLGFFIPENASFYNSNLVYQKFNESNFKTVRLMPYVGEPSCNYFQRYVSSSFQKENMELEIIMTVPTVADTLRAAAHLANATTITTFWTAQQVFPDLNFNFIPLPANFMSLDSTINYRPESSTDVVEVAAYLQAELSKVNDKILA